MNPKVVLFLLSLLTLLAPAWADGVYHRDHRLMTIETAHFTFVFPGEFQSAAEHLVSFAEDLYADVAAQLTVPADLRIPVVLTPDTDDLNGYFSPLTSMRIGLHLAPLSPSTGFARYDDTLKKLFLHELVHAVSLMQTDGFSAFLVALFGDALYPANWAAPQSFVEGVTVSFESRDGFGRANDTPYASVIQQAIVEDRWPTLTEVAGAREGYPGGIWYIYGGWFSRYLQDTWGMPKYAALWKEIGRGKALDDFLWFQGAFRRVYGLTQEEAWAGFRQWMAPRTPVRTDTQALVDAPGYLQATAAGNGAVYWSDFRGLWELRDGRTTLLTEAGRRASRLVLSPDGTRLLASALVQGAEAAEARVTEYDLGTRRPTNRTFPAHLTEAAYRGDGLVACRIAGPTLDLVTVDGGQVTVLVHGTERLCPSTPSVLGDGRIAFLLQEDGVTRPALLDPEDGSVTAVETGLGGIRHLSAEGNRLWFVWDSDRTILKLGRLEGTELTTWPSLSGGVQYPSARGQEVVYAGFFARGHKLMRLPADLPTSTSQARLVPLEASALTAPGAYDRKPALAARPYNPLAWVLVPQIRYPVLSLDTTAGLAGLVRGAGLGTLASDPTEALMLTTSAAWLWNDRYADLAAEGAWRLPAVDLGFGLSDHLVPGTGTDPDTRQVRARFQVGDTVAEEARSLAWAAEVSWVQAGRGLTGTAPYGWAWDTSAVPVGLGAVYRNLRSTDLDGQLLGYRLDLGWDGVFAPGTLQTPPGLVQTALNLSLPWMRTHLGLLGAASTHPSLALGVAGPRPEDGSAWLGGQRYSQGVFTDDPALRAPWLVQAQADLGISLPIRHDLPFGWYAHSLDLQAGYLGLALDGAYLDDLFAVIALDFRAAVVPAALVVPLGIGLRIDQPFPGSGRQGPVLGLYLGGALY